MDLENVKLFYKSKTVLVNLCQHKKLYEVFNEIWTTKHKNNKGIYVCLNKTEVYGAFRDAWSSTLKMYSNCEADNCLYCKRFNFVFNQLKNTDFNIKFPNNLWRIYLNTNDHGFEIENTLFD